MDRAAGAEVTVLLQDQLQLGAAAAFLRGHIKASIAINLVPLY